MGKLRKYSELRLSQRVAIEKARTTNSLMLGMGMGLGKTVSALTIAREALDSIRVRHVLVIAPLLVAEEVWPAEIGTWEHTAALSYVVATGTARQRAKKVETLPEITIINVENIPWLVEFWGDDWPYDMLIIDEISRFKNPTKLTKPSKAAVAKIIESVRRDFYGRSPSAIEGEVQRRIKKLTRNRTRFGALSSILKHVRMAVGLTGTMVPKGLLDLWSQYYVLDQGDRLGGSYYDYRRKYFESDYMGYNWTPKKGAFEEITYAIKDITVSMRTEDWVDLPPLLNNVIKVKLPAKVMKKYKELERDLGITIDDFDIEALNNAVLTGKLLQMANGGLYVDGPEDEPKSYVQVDDSKLKALDSVIEEAAGAPVLVAYSFQFDLERLKKRYPKAEVVGESPNVQARWNRGEIPILLAHPASAGHGLNLQAGGHITVWYGLPWSLEYYQQLNKRLHRPGQKETVVIHHIIAEGTVDERVMATLPERAKMQDSVTEATLWREV